MRPGRGNAPILDKVAGCGYNKKKRKFKEEPLWQKPCKIFWI